MTKPNALRGRMMAAPRRTTDPLVHVRPRTKAMFAVLPNAGQPFPEADRAAWIRLLELVMNDEYPAAPTSEPEGELT